MDTPTPCLKLIRDKIRFGQEPDNPTLVSLWLHAEQNELDHHLSTHILRQSYEAQFYLLLEAIVDELVSRQWRCTCLDNIYRPLSCLQKLSNSKASCERIRDLMKELAVTSRYVEHSLRM
ncbi:hypothetical protein M9194_02060 [Vibrio sp. S4M6]|uniref:hypothetical protein n=1 Tax=Vibrio sinus TaxID=2946865 RepID=UPI002029DC36|nr:hypothetical protein [Vibrio sinus]MCL9780214.1 hypothetical protein [Vibrio sinus]